MECHVKPDTAIQPNLLNKLTATAERKWELVVVLNGINSLSGLPALEMACGNFLYVLKKVFVPLIWTWSIRDNPHFFLFIVQWLPLSFPELLFWKPALFSGSESGNSLDRHAIVSMSAKSLDSIIYKRNACKILVFFCFVVTTLCKTLPSTNYQVSKIKWQKKWRIQKYVIWWFNKVVLCQVHAF